MVLICAVFRARATVSREVGGRAVARGYEEAGEIRVVAHR